MQRLVASFSEAEHLKVGVDSVEGLVIQSCHSGPRGRGVNHLRDDCVRWLLLNQFMLRERNDFALLGRARSIGRDWSWWPVPYGAGLRLDPPMPGFFQNFVAGFASTLRRLREADERRVGRPDGEAKGGCRCNNWGP